MSLIFNICVLIFIILFSIHKLNKNYKIFYLLLYIYYQGMITSASLTYIETGIYISEQDRDSYFVGANLYFLIFFILSIQTIEIVIRTFDKGVRPHFPKFKLGQWRFEYNLIYMSGVVILCSLVLNLLLSSSPLFDDSVTRFTYWQHSTIPIFRTLFGKYCDLSALYFWTCIFKERKELPFFCC